MQKDSCHGIVVVSKSDFHFDLVLNYLEYHFRIYPLSPAREVLMGELVEINFDSFVDTENGLIAYILEGQEVPDLNDLISFNMDGTTIEYEVKKAEDKNWNEEWEKNFDPIEIEDKLRIRALFHGESPGFAQEIIIQPQMSFGTGHHETTYMICSYMFSLDLENRKVLDMGCGTGVLAILAEKQGASAIDAVDIDDWSYQNSMENLKLNHCEKINVFHGDKNQIIGKRYDVILANINRNILVSDMETYAECLNDGGEIILSGFYETDIESILNEAKKHGLKKISSTEKNSWAMLHVSSNL